MADIVSWLEHYGYWVLFLALMLEMLALPLPGEFTMSYAGLLVYQGDLDWALCILAAGGGTCVGMTMSYLIAYRLGMPFFEKYGSRFHLGPDKLALASKWFQKYGNKLLIFAYFIPVVRHITGYFSGTMRLDFRKYAAYAYAGAFFWSGLFISLGKVLGPKWEQYHHVISRYMIIGGMVSAGVFVLFYLYRKHKDRIIKSTMGMLDKALGGFHQLDKVKYTLLASFILFVLFFILMIGVIQDFLANEFVLFDEVAEYIVHQAVGPDGAAWMARFDLLGSYYVLAPLIAITAAWIIFKGNDRLLELTFLGVVVVGGEALETALLIMFHRTVLTPAGLERLYSFPSEQTLITLAVCGFAGYLLARRYRSATLRVTVTGLVILVCLLVGCSRIYFNLQYPSDVVAGYVFGGVWLTLNIILMEIFRLVRDRQFSV